MKTSITLVVAFITTFFATAQTEHVQVTQTLQNYIDGSSYNKLDVLESAFFEDATLYLTMKDGFKVLSPKTYVGFFKNGEYGKFNGREGKILAIDINKDIATAKVEIKFPSKNMIYIDLFLLKKTSQGWKIISKTATRIDEAKKK